MKASLWIGALVVVAAVYLAASSAALQAAIGYAATAAVRPIVIPLIELINVPAFVYCMATLIMLAGGMACVTYEIASLRPHLAELRAVRVAIGDLPQPRLAGSVTEEAWVQARQSLAVLLHRRGVFVAGWSAFQAESLRGRGVPDRSLSSFVAAEPSDMAEPGGFMRTLPGYFTSVGLILTFIGLVVALYFAAKGFRNGDIAQARTAIVQLLNAASFKFLTSVSALISALMVSLYGRYGASAVYRERRHTLERVDLYLTEWRERVGSGQAGETLAPRDLLRRFDKLLTSLATLAQDVRSIAERSGTVTSNAPHEV